MKNSDEKLYYVQGTPVPETPQGGKEPQPWQSTNVVGKPLPRIDAYERVSGAAVYPSDITFSDMLHGAILTCPYPNAK